jgi:glycosyltransferase involved in cell wall biosynthesis
LDLFSRWKSGHNMLASGARQVDASKDRQFQMKIVHVETGRHFYGGAQQVIWLMKGLQTRGIDNVLVCARHAAIESIARELGVRIVALPCSGDLDLGFVWRLRRVLTNEAPDVVHCHSRRGADFLGGQAASMTGTPAILTRRVDHSEPAVMAALRYRRFARIIAISENIASVLRAAGVSDDRLVVIRSAVETGQLARVQNRAILEKEFGIGEKEMAIAIVAQLIPRKGHRFLFEALSSITGHPADLRLVVFGSGVLEDELKRLVSALGLQDIVQFAGYRSDLDDLLVNFDMLVHPALREGLGVAMLKAAAAGLPVIAFDVAGAREAVQNEVTGLLVPSSDSAMLADAIARLSGDATLRRKLGENGFLRMKKEFSIEAMVDKHVQTYKATIDA